MLRCKPANCLTTPEPTQKTTLPPRTSPTQRVTQHPKSQPTQRVTLPPRPEPTQKDTLPPKTEPQKIIPTVGMKNKYMNNCYRGIAYPSFFTV